MLMYVLSLLTGVKEVTFQRITNCIFLPVLFVSFLLSFCFLVSYFSVISF